MKDYKEINFLSTEPPAVRACVAAINQAIREEYEIAVDITVRRYCPDVFQHIERQDMIRDIIRSEESKLKAFGYEFDGEYLLNLPSKN